VIDPEVQRAAEFLAARAVLLVGLGIVAAVAAVLAVVGALRILHQYQPALRQGFTLLLVYVPWPGTVQRAATRTRAAFHGSYLTVHLGLGLALTVAVSLFVVVAEDVFGGGDLVAFDLAFAGALREASSPGAERFFAVVSSLGERETIAIATLAIAVWLLRESVLLAAWWVAAQAGGGVLNLVLKGAFERTRPEYADPLLAASSWSFPSGHAMGTFILFGLGCYVLLRHTRSWTVAAIAVGASLSWCLVMAFSRLYLGVHFASDVMAGVVAGAAWVAVCASAFEVIRRRRQGTDGRDV
jgi:membrane-associated phospholipid phosphatase